MIYNYTLKYIYLYKFIIIIVITLDPDSAQKSYPARVHIVYRYRRGSTTQCKDRLPLCTNEVSAFMAREL